MWGGNALHYSAFSPSSQVCELDIIFNFEKAYFILDEFLMGGDVQDTSKKSVLKAIEQADLLQEVWAWDSEEEEEYHGRRCPPSPGHPACLPHLPPSHHHRRAPLPMVSGPLTCLGWEVGVADSHLCQFSPSGKTQGVSPQAYLPCFSWHIRVAQRIGEETKGG